jgi:hypothetical protein
MKEGLSLILIGSSLIFRPKKNIFLTIYKHFKEFFLTINI